MVDILLVEVLEVQHLPSPFKNWLAACHCWLAACSQSRARVSLSLAHEQSSHPRLLSSRHSVWCQVESLWQSLCRERDATVILLRSSVERAPHIIHQLDALCITMSAPLNLLAMYRTECKQIILVKINNVLCETFVPERNIFKSICCLSILMVRD